MVEWQYNVAGPSNERLSVRAYCWRPWAKRARCGCNITSSLDTNIAGNIMQAASCWACCSCGGGGVFRGAVQAHNDHRSLVKVSALISFPLLSLSLSMAGRLAHMQKRSLQPSDTSQ